MNHEKEEEMTTISLRVPKNLVDFFSQWMNQEEIREYFEELLTGAIKSEFETEKFQKDYLKIALTMYGLEDWLE